MNTTKFLILGTLVAGLFLTMTQPASATEYDIRGIVGLTPIPTAEGTALVEEFTTEGSTGTGTFKPFLQVNQLGGHPKSPVYGYSTNLAVPNFPVTFYTTEPTYTPTTAELPIVEEGGIDYIEFVCDNNQKNNAAGRQLSFDQLKIYQTENANINYTELSGLVPIWDLDSAEDSWIHLNAQFGSGSGSGDMRILIPYSLFNPATTYVVAWVSFGGNPGADPSDDTQGVESDHPNNDGFEEFGYLLYPTQPDTMVTIVTSAAPENLIYAGDTVDLTVTETNTGNAPLDNVSVTVNDGTTDIATLDGTTAIESVTDNDILDIGETWTWNATTNPGPSNSLNDIVVSAQTTFTVTGYGEDEGTPITYPDYPNEQAEITVYTIDPDTLVDIDASAYVVYTGGTVDLYVSEENTGDDPLTNVSVTVTGGGLNVTLDENTAGWSSDGNLDDVLDPGETWSWTISSVAVSADTTFTAIGTGTDSLGGTVTAPAYEDEEDTVDVDVIGPGTLVDIDSSAYTVRDGDTVDLDVSEENTGDDPLTNVYVVVTGGGLNVTLDENTAGWSSDGNLDDVLDPGETWSWTISSVTITGQTTFTATGHGTDSLGSDITSPAYPDEQDTVDVDTIGPNTAVDIDASAYMVYDGDTVDLYVSEENTGNDPLDNVYVVVTGGGLNATLDETDLSWSSDGNLDDVLDPGETWYWTIGSVAVSGQTTFTATGHGTDSLGGDVTYPAYPDEQDTVDVGTIGPNTQVDIDASAYIVYAGDTVDLYVSEENTGDDDLTNVSVTVTGGGLNVTLDENTAGWSSDGNLDDVLDVGETWSWTISGVVVSSDTTFTATGTGTDSLGGTVTVPDYEDEEDTVDVDTIDPDTLVTIEPDVYETIPGGNVILTISEENTGDDPLTNVSVTVTGGGLNVTLDETDLSWSSDGNLDDVLDPGETWTWTIQVTISVDTTFTATGTGTDSLGNPVTIPTNPLEYDEVTVEVEQDFTRTWGFWKTHLFLVQYALDPGNGLVTLPIDLGDWGQGPMLIYDDCDYMGLMWSKQSQNSDGGPREKIDAARIHTAHQALAAIMNSYMPNGATLPVSLSEIASILSTGNIKQIRDLGSELAAYNESGEDIALDPSLPPTGKVSGNIADPQGARDVGAPCEADWDTPEATKGGKPPK